MLRGLLGLTWLEIKIFVREPMGVIGTVGVPVLLFVVLGLMLGPRVHRASSDVPSFVSVDLPIFASLLIAANAVLSLIAIMAIYREGGILKRLRATPLRPHTILTAHVIVKLLFTAVTLAAMVLVGPRYYPVGADVPPRVVHGRAPCQRGEHPVARFSHRQHRPHRAVRAADLHRDYLPHAWSFRVVLPRRVVAAAAAGDCTRAALHLRSLATQRHLAGQRDGPITSATS